MNYQPQTGFFDISERPKTLDRKTHAKMQEVQMWLMHVQKHKEQFKNYHPHQWEKAKEMSGHLQQCIFQHYSYEELFG